MRAALAFAAIALLPTLAHARDNGGDPRHVEARIMRDYRLSAAVIGVSRRGGRPEFQVFNGTAAVPVTPDSIFAAGSISKTFAAWTAMHFVETGKLGLDAPIAPLVHRWRIPPSVDGDTEVTLRRLLSHTAGISLDGYRGWDRVGDVPSIESSLAGNSNGAGAVRVFAKPGTRYAYSGGGYSVAQLAIEELGAKSYASTVREIVADPLGLSSVTYMPEAAPGFAQPVDRHGRIVARSAFAEGAAAGLYISPRDLMRFALAQRIGARGPLSEASRQIMHAPQALRLPRDELNIQLMWAMDPDPTHRASSVSYGLGAQIFQMRTGETVIGHSGSINGARSMMYVVPSTGDAIVGTVAGENGNALLSYALCQWRHAITTSGGRAVRCPLLAEPLLYDAFEAGRVAAVVARHAALARTGRYDLNEQVLLNLIATARSGTLGAPATPAEIGELLSLARRAHGRSQAVMMASARDAQERGDSANAAQWLDRARSIDAGEPELVDLASAVSGRRAGARP